MIYHELPTLNYDFTVHHVENSEGLEGLMFDVLTLQRDVDGNCPLLSSGRSRIGGWRTGRVCWLENHQS